VNRSTSARTWTALALACLGIFGVAFAVSSVSAPLPANAEGTCGPGTGSEAAIAAFLNPGSIGAGAKPPASNAAASQSWHAFVNSCQSATDDRMLVAGSVLVVSLGVGIIGPLVILRKKRRRGDPELDQDDPVDAWWTPEATSVGAGAPYAAPGQTYGQAYGQAYGPPTGAPPPMAAPHIPPPPVTPPPGAPPFAARPPASTPFPSPPTEPPQRLDDRG
jgi:hypothetical protein